MDLNKVFDSFVSVLSKQRQHLTEDNIRYYLFAKMYDQDNDLTNYCLELPYNNEIGNPIKGNYDELDFSGLNHRELDMFYNGDEKIAMEIKFHRPSKTATGLPNKAGELFNDLKRLELIKQPNVRKIFVYVTDDEMHNYFLSSTRGITNPQLNSF